jgi:hypothetical protein
MTTATAYPLTWPDTLPRRRADLRDKGQFKTTLTGAIRNVQDSLRLFASDSGRKLENLVISSNYSLGVERPADPGVAVWFVWDGMQVCIPVDRYQTIAANLQAIHHIIEARRVELRHGTLALVRASFTGFLALPAPGGKRHWREVLCLKDPGRVTEGQIKMAHRDIAKTLHPDAGGSDEKMAELNRARDEALKEIS